MSNENVMKKGTIISAIDSLEKVAGNLAKILREATDDDLIHAFEYAYTDGGKNPDGDSQAKRLKVLRTTLRRERGITVKRKDGVWIVAKIAERAPQQPKGEGDAKVPGKRSKPSQALSKDEEKAATKLEGKTKADKMEHLVRQLERLGITIGELEEYMVERDAMKEAA